MVCKRRGEFTDPLAASSRTPCGNFTDRLRLLIVILESQYQLLPRQTSCWQYKAAVGHTGSRTVAMARGPQAKPHLNAIDLSLFRSNLKGMLSFISLGVCFLAQSKTARGGKKRPLAYGPLGE